MDCGEQRMFRSKKRKEVEGREDTNQGKGSRENKARELVDEKEPR